MIIDTYRHISSIYVQYSKLSVCPSVGIRSTTVELPPADVLYVAATLQVTHASSCQRPPTHECLNFFGCISPLKLAQKLIGC